MDNILVNKDMVLDDFNHQAIAKKLAERIKRHRLQHNLTQVSLSKKSGVSLGRLKRFENTYQISLKHLLQLALVLDSLDGFHQLFPEKNFQSINEIINTKKVKERKRGRGV